MLGHKNQDFWPKINVRNENCCILCIQCITVHQHFHMIFENKVFQKLQLPNKRAPKLLISIKKNQKILMILDIKVSKF